MSKFFTPHLLGLLVCLQSALASEDMAPPHLATPSPATSEGEARGQTSDLPRRLEAKRFAPLAKKSPFTLASTAEENADFAKDLILAGYVRMDGQDFVIVANRTRPERLMVGTKLSPGAQGMVLLKVDRDPSGDPAKLRAQIRKGTETANLKYETATAAVGQLPPGQAPVGQAPVPGQPQPPQAVPPVPGQKTSPTQPVIRRRVMPIPPPPPPSR